MYARSPLLVLEQLTDRQTGATIAAPEFDPTFEQSGGYGFVWPRDLGYVVLSFLAAGRSDLAVPALRWLAREQAPEGLWLQRYWTDGSLARAGDSTSSTRRAWSSSRTRRPGVSWETPLSTASCGPPRAPPPDFLCGFVDPETGLPLPSVDPGADRRATLVQRSRDLRRPRRGRGDGDPPRAVTRGALSRSRRAVREAIETHLWSDEHGRYLRSRWVGSGELGGAACVVRSALRYPTKAVRSVDPEDAVDSSLLGLAWPFAQSILLAEDARDGRGGRARARTPEGGVLRHEDDDYAGGNPWLISTLWLGPPSGRRATRRVIARRSRTRSRSRPRWASCRSRSRATASRPGSCRSAGATRCSSSPRAPSWRSSATAPD